MRVLVVEDEHLLAQAIAKGLTKNSFAVDVAEDGNSALEMLEIYAYDVVVLDRDLPGVHGDDVCGIIVRDYPQTRVLMLTAARSLGDRVGGFELGADDYLTKPFDFPELLARIRALGRRSETARQPQLNNAGITLDPFRHQVFRNGREVYLSPKEFAVLHVLMAAQGGVLSAEHILEKAWDAHADPFSNAIRVTIFHLRKKLGDPEVIHTVTGAGYFFGEPR